MREGRKWHVLLVIGIMACFLALTGCEGDDGSRGPAGPEGPAGEPGPVTTTNESCTVCHEVGSIAGMELGHDLDDYPAVETVEIDDVTFNSVAGDGSDISVTFSVRDADGELRDDMAGHEGSVAITKLVPGTGNEFVWVPYIYRGEDTSTSTAGPGGTPVLALADQGTSADCAFTATATAGQYTCDLPDISNVTTPTNEAVPFEPSLTHRVGIYYEGATEDVIGDGDTDFVPDTIITDGLDLTAAETDVVNTRNIATIESCNECHGQIRAHGGDRFTVRNCVLCHNPETTDANSGLSVNMSEMIHSIHAGEHLTNDYTIWGYQDRAHNYNEVLYPERLTNCEKCHTVDDAETPDGDNWNTTPTIAACIGCHDDVNFETGENHAGGAAADNQFCAGCHSAEAIVGYHTPDPAPENVAEFDVNIDMEAPANGTHYVEGEAPVVTVTLAAADGGPAADYTAATDEPGDRDGALSSADLTVYGPRSHADEVLGGGGSLMLPSEDAQVLTDADGFKYQLAAIPADMEPGTYAVHFEGGDYGPVSDEDYHTHSIEVMTFQVGTADEEPKVAGDCKGCHGDTRIHVEGAHPHNAEFDTDECNACHNYSGGYATPLIRRVHAVHAASGLGADGHDRIWDGSGDSEYITYPQEVNHCQSCHSSGKETFRTNQSSLVCVGCHGDSEAVKDHMIQNGGEEL